MTNTSDEPNALSPPPLERRRSSRSSEASARISAADSTLPTKSFGAEVPHTLPSAAISAVYLIEREAIRLRRLRLEEIHQRPASGVVESLVTPGEAPREPELPMELHAYARPPEASAGPLSFNRRFGAYLRGWFGTRPKS